MREEHHGKALGWSWELNRQVLFIIAGTLRATGPSKPQVRGV